ncbi:MAG: DUF2520 domain-containing protein [Prevotellaceae bacterium]|jgi:predicted short-subunit dehydrogenase-like oxidoreductase (DUF2520 family)|nr:DUF2520 domain-containing protein [Prevotellaceae bacterium]
MPKKVTVIGSGNVATQLATALYAKGCAILEISSPAPAHAQTLAQTVNARAAGDVRKLLPADIYIIAVTDAAIPEVAEKLHAGDALVVHTSGSTNISALNKFARRGVLYPLQTFTRKHPPDWHTVPLFIMANTGEALQELQNMASLLSRTVIPMPPGDLLRLHTAGVFTNNFVNYLLGIAKDLAGEQFHRLYPLARETVEKAFAAGHPREVQTGPAARNDAGTMAKQLAILPPEQQLLYKQISSSIALHKSTD